MLCDRLFTYISYMSWMCYNGILPRCHTHCTAQHIHTNSLAFIFGNGPQNPFSLSLFPSSTWWKHDMLLLLHKQLHSAHTHHIYRQQRNHRQLIMWKMSAKENGEKLALAKPHIGKHIRHAIRWQLALVQTPHIKAFHSTDDGFTWLVLIMPCTLTNHFAKCRLWLSIPLV